MLDVTTAGRRSSDFAREVELDGIGEGVPRRLIWAAFWSPLAGLAALLLAAVVFRPAYDRMLQEDYPVEWAQFALCLFVSVICVLASAQLIRRQEYAIVAVLILLALGSFMLAGEEISWGQRVFGLATPQELSGINDQAELNIHNITAGFDLEAAFRWVALMIGLGGTVLPLLARLPPVRLAGRFWQVISPPLFTVPLFAMMLGYRVFRLIVSGEVNFAVRLQEWIEFCQYLGLALTATCIYLQTRRPGGAPAQGRHVNRTGGDRDLRTVVSAATAILALTCLFALLSAISGVRAGNAL